MNEMIYEMKHILNYGYGIKYSYDPCIFAKIAAITARIIVLLDFISAVQYMIHFTYHFVH